MKVIVYNDRSLNVIYEYSTQNENDFEVMEFKFSSIFDNYNKKIVFLTPDGNISYYIKNNKFFIPREITQYEQVKFYIWCTFENKDFRTKLKILSFYKNENVNIDILPLEKAQIEEIINELEKNILIVQNLEKQTNNLIDEIETKLKNGDFVGPQGPSGPPGPPGPQGDPGESYDDTEIKEEITDIKEEQLTQNTDIETLQTQVADLEEQVQELENNQLTGTATGQSIYIEDSTNTKVRDIGLSGNSEQESTSGKNKLPTNNMNKTQANVTITPQSNGYILMNGTKYGVNAFNFTNNKFELKAGTYKFILRSVSGSDSHTANEQIKLIGAKNTINLTHLQTITTNNFTVTEDDTFYPQFNLIDNSKYTDWLFYIMIVDESVTDYTYEPYTGGQASPNPSYPQEIHSTGDSGSVSEKLSNSDGTQEQNISFPLAQGQKLMQGDYLADDGIHHVRGEEVLDGTENITIGTGGVSEPTNKYFDITKTTNIAKNNTTLKCTHFIQRTIWGVDQIGINYEGAANSKSVRIRANFSTIEDFKAWLAQQYANGTPVKVQYELAEEVIEAYTEEQQAVWEQIKALRTYKPVTHISSTDEVPATVNITYVKDLETVINNLGGA